MSREVVIPVTFKIGTLEEIGLGGFKVSWVEAEDPDGTRLELLAGAGCGSSLLEASAALGDKHVYARASITPLAQDLFGELHREVTDER